ncbi:uncharacterized protein LOC133325777 [Musca vetustissima]|uniref:uncharacterized protein LOC133325777 n=1 Tax=Musca vetustissima TaxID=27455 RepID=UPI002AB74479|nr:uncharacterized protein LOC133325777 [Musca vetustissima]
MYAAAGGASLASRQARQRQRQQKKSQQLQAKLHPPKAPCPSVGEHGASTPTRHSRQFHQLPNNYLRTPQAQGRKLSASYTAQSKLLLPIDEGDTQSVMHMRIHSHPHAHGHSHHAHSHSHQEHQHMVPYTGHHHHGRVSPKLVHRHSGSSGTSFHHSHLPKSATATLPLVSQVEATPPTSPSGVAAAGKPDDATALPPTTCQEAGIPMAYHDSIIVTPATPMASPGHVAKPHEELPDAVAEKQPLTAAADSCDDDDQAHPPTGPLERKCSVYRMRRSDAFEHDPPVVIGGVRRQFKELQFNQQNQHYEPLLTDDPHLVFKGLPSTTAGRKIQICAYCEEGICVCEHIECAQGRAAWLERGRRCSVQEAQQQATCHRRWVKRNRIQDASLGGSSDDEDFLGVLRGPSTFANAFLYVGLGTIALGLVIAFVGTGEKGFKTVELRLIGPSLIGLGFICCLLRILFCICPSHCIANKKNDRKKNGNKIDADYTTSLLRGEIKRVSITRAPGQQSRVGHKRSNSKMLNEGMEALRQIATTSLFMQNEQKPMTNRIVPIIKEPDVTAGKHFKKTDIANTSRASRSSSQNKSATKEEIERNESTAVQNAPPTNLGDKNISSPVPPVSGFNSNKLSRQRISVHQQNSAASLLLHNGQPLSSKDDAKDLQMETSLIFVRNPNLEKEMCPPLHPTTTSAATSRTCPSSVSTHLSPPESTDIPTIHSSNVINSIKQKTEAYNTTNTASTYAAALAAAASSRGNSERTESLVRGPLAMPLSMLTASTSTYALPSSAPSISLTKSITTSPLPVQPSTAPTFSKTTDQSGAISQQIMPGQVIDETFMGQTLSSTDEKNSEPPQSHPVLKFPASTMLSSTYSGSSSTLSPNSLVGSTSFSVSSTLPTPLGKFEPEILLSPAKLGQ